MAEAIPTMDSFVLQWSQKISFLSSDQNKKRNPGAYGKPFPQVPG
jgi:hypothetical protein